MLSTLLEKNRGLLPLQVQLEISSLAPSTTIPLHRHLTKRHLDPPSVATYHWAATIAICAAKCMQWLPMSAGSTDVTRLHLSRVVLVRSVLRSTPMPLYHVRYLLLRPFWTCGVPVWMCVCVYVWVLLQLVVFVVWVRNLPRWIGNNSQTHTAIHLMITTADLAIVYLSRRLHNWLRLMCLFIMKCFMLFMTIILS